MRYILFTFSLFLWGCTSAPQLPQANGQSGMLLIPTIFESTSGGGSFAYSYIMTYSGPQSGSEQIYAQLGKEYALIGPLAPGQYTMDTMQLFGGRTSRARASSLGHEPMNMGAPFEIKPNTITTFCCALGAMLSKVRGNFTQHNDILDVAEGGGLRVKQRAQQSLASDPSFSGWTVE